MAAAAQMKVLFDGGNLHIVNITGTWDTADEVDTIVFNASDYKGPDGQTMGAGSTKIEEITYSVSGDFESVNLEWDATTDDVIEKLSGQGYFDYKPFGGKQDPASTGGTGDIVLTSVGGTTNSNYSILMVIRKKQNK